MTKVQRAVGELLQQLAPWLSTGQLTLNLREKRLESVETKTYGRITKNVVDKPEAPAHAGSDLT